MNGKKPGADRTFQLLNRNIPEDYLEEWTLRVAAPEASIHRDAESIMVFRIGSEWFGIRSSAVQEVMEAGPIHRLPHHRNGVVLGVVNVRGQLVACVSLAQLLNAGEGATDCPRLLVAGSVQERLAIPVSEIFGMLRYDIRDLHKAPATLAETRFTSGILSWNDRSIACLDSTRVLSSLRKALS